jgi:hypothetical protein
MKQLSIPLIGTVFLIQIEVVSLILPQSRLKCF